MALNRRDFLKFSAGAGLMVTTGARPTGAAPRGELSPEAVGILYDATSLHRLHVVHGQL